MVALKPGLLALLICLAAGCAGVQRPTPPAFSPNGVQLHVEGLQAGSTVAVAGSFNGWNGAETRLAEKRPGEFSGFVPLAPGVYRLQLVVHRPDGSESWVAPPGLARYEPDGFGGRNGVVEVAP